MEYLLPLIAKSFLVASVVLLLLRLAGQRSASQRSWIAHLGLVAILLLPVATMMLPAIEVKGPPFLTSALTSPPAEIAPAATVIAPESVALPEDTAKSGTEPAAAAGPFPQASRAIDVARSVDWALWIYAGPAALLLLLTLIALGRLVALRARATVLVEANWLTALARAQRRMGFKHGTALLTSDELPSPISWGLMRPVILLNSEAARSHKEAEAIIAHELAHVAGLDWAKLMLSRVTVALFWFNPLVWILAREAHQLREEAADDAVLGADIEDTAYAKLLVGVARHECRGLLIGAHGVAPGRNSLSRRVRRVLDSSLARGPIGGAFALGVFVGAAMLAAPLAALTLTSKPAPVAAPVTLAQPSLPQAPYYPAAPVAAPVTIPVGAEADTHPGLSWKEQLELKRELAQARAELARARRTGASGEAISAAVASAVAVSVKASRVDRMTGPSMFGVTPRYAAEMRAASPRLARIGTDDLVAFRIHGVSPAYVRDLEASGLRGLSPEQLTAAAIHGVNGRFLRSMAAVGYPRLSYKEAVNMRIHGVTPEFVRSLQRRGIRHLSATDVIKYRIVGFVDPDTDVDVDDDS
jgi:beta-lactamase regulating signal transducer with metallopeptidase domain